MDKETLLDKVKQVKELIDEAGVSDIYCGNRDSSENINLLTVAIDNLADIVRDMINTIE